MLDELQFWRKWSKPTRLLYVVSLSILALAILFFAFYHVLGLGSVIDWNISYDIQNIEVSVDHVRHKLFDMPVQSENYVVFQYFNPSAFRVSHWASGVFVFIMAFAGTISIAVITTYKKMIWFATGSFLFVLWLTFLKLDLLGVFDQFNNTLLGSMLLVYLGLAYYFHTWNTGVIFIKRFFAFLTVTAFFGLVIFAFSKVEHPVEHLASFSCIGGGVVLFIFMCVIGYEVLQLALTIITMSKNSNPWSTPLNFFIISALYIGNIILYFLYINELLDWKIPYNVYVFFPICTIIGIWSHRKRSVLYNNILPFAPGGAFLFLGLAIASVATLGYITAIQLTPALKVFETLFLVTQASFGIAFFAYVVRNFYKPMIANMYVGKMIYQPRLMAHYAVRVTGSFVILFFIGGCLDLVRGQLKASNYTLKGNWYLSSKDYLVAEQNYKKALLICAGEHQASYGLASIYIQNLKISQALEVLEKVKKDERSPFLYTSIANIYRDADQGMNQLLLLQEAHKIFPESEQIANNLALAFNHLGLKDSALIYIQKAIEIKNNPTSHANLIALAAIHNMSDGKTFAINPKYAKDNAYMANAYALANVSKVELSEEFDFKNLKKDGSGLMLSLINNYVDKNIHSISPDKLQLIDLWADSLHYSSNHNNALFIQAKANFYNGNAEKGLAVFKTLIRTAQLIQKPFYQNFAALLYTKVGLYKQAYDLLFDADQLLQMSNQNFVRENTAVLALETKNLDYAKLILPYLSSTVPHKKEQYNALLEVLNGETQKTPYHQAAHLLFFASDSANYKTTLNNLPAGKLKDVVILNLIDKELGANNRGAVQELWKIAPNQLDDKSVFQYSNLLNMRTLQMFGDSKGLKDKMNTIDLDPFQRRWITYFDALIAQSEKDTAKASLKFDEALKQFPKNESVLLSYLTYYQEIGKHKKAYDICADYLIINPHTSPMVQKFVQLALANKLYFFATESANELGMLMNPAQYASYRAEFDAIIRKIEAQQF